MIDKIKLYFILALLAIVGAAFAALLYALWDQSRDLAIAQSQVQSLTIERDQLVDANIQTMDALTRVASARASDNEQFKLLSDKLGKIQQQIATAQANRKKAADNDPEVKAFLSTPIPNALRVRAGTKSSL